MWPGSRLESRAGWRGLTLVETLISAGLLGLVMAGVYAVLVLSFRYQRKLADSVETFQQALQATTRMSQALGTGCQASMLVEPQGFAFVSAQPPRGPFTHDASGRLEWHKFAFFYLENGNLYRGELTFPATTTAPPVPALDVLKADPGASKLLTAERVRQLEVTSGSGATIKLKVAGKAEGDPNSVLLQSRITFRQ